MKRPLHKRGGHGTLGMTLRELEDLVAQANKLGYDKDKTRLCSSRQRSKGLVDVYLIESYE